MRSRNASAAKKARAVELYYQYGSVVAGGQVGVDAAAVVRWVRQFESGRTFDEEVVRPASEGWRDRAACEGAPQEWFFVGRGQPSTEAKTLCGRCPVQVECLEYALVMRERFGVWGGLTFKERLEYRRRRESKVA